MAIVTVAGNSIDLSQVSYISSVYLDRSTPISSYRLSPFIGISAVR